jgi:carboxyl-terminal processing protease
MKAEARLRAGIVEQNRRSPSGSRRTLRYVILLSLTLVPSLAPRAYAQAPSNQAPEVNPYEVLDRLGQGLAVVEQSYFEAPDRNQLATGALRGAVAELDPHSSYLSPDALKLFDEDTSGTFGGIGVEVDLERGEAIVIAPIEGSPADRAGIESGDAIVRLNGVPLAERKPEEIIQAMRGPIGSSLWLTLRNRRAEFRELEITREAIVVQSVRMTRLVNNLLYLRIKSFQSGTHSELTASIATFRKQYGQETGLILDLRNNPGGLVREATAVADEFLSAGEIFETRHRGRIERREGAHLGGAATTGPLLVLVNEYSASASELVAAALQGNGRARIVGAKTFGKGSVQTVLPLSENSAVKLTTALYYSPKGRTLQAEGVTPDFPVDPGYRSGNIVVTERDLPGHIQPHETPSDTANGNQGPKRASEPVAPPTDDEVHHGVLRTLREDPRGSGDRTLAFAVDLLLREAKR